MRNGVPQLIDYTQPPSLEKLRPSFGAQGRMFQNGGQINNTQKVESGLLKFKGPTHANGGIPFEGVEVEGEETNWKNYIFSDRLKYRHVK